MPHAISSDGAAISCRQLRSVPPSSDVLPRRRNHAPLSARVTEKPASRDTVANEEKPARAANAQGHYRAPALSFPRRFVAAGSDALLRLGLEPRVVKKKIWRALSLADKLNVLKRSALIASYLPWLGGSVINPTNLDDVELPSAATT